MGKMYRSTCDVQDDIKEQDRKMHRTKHYHPQLKDEIKQELLLERKRKDKGRRNTYAQQRKLKQGVTYNDDEE